MFRPPNPKGQLNDDKYMKYLCKHQTIFNIKTPPRQKTRPGGEP